MISPGTFIPLAEEIGLIVPLGEWAIRRGLRHGRAMARRISRSPSTSRRCSSAARAWCRSMVGALAASGLAPERLELEITETILLQDSEATLAMLYQLRELGVRIAMDDFGTGYSSLSYLQSFPFDKIKIDRSFVKDIADGVRLAQHRARGGGAGQRPRHDDHRRGRRDPGAARHRPAEGCTEMQGFLFSRPLPAGEIERLFLAGMKQGNSGRIVAA